MTANPPPPASPATMEAQLPKLTLLDANGRLEGCGAASEIRVVIADGQSLVRTGLRALLEASARVRVVAEAATGDEAVEAARCSRPDVVMIDAALPGLDAVEATAQMYSETGVAVALLVATEWDERIIAALRAGASGLVLKDAEPSELVRTVDALARGEAMLSSCLARRVIAELAARPEPSCPRSELLKELTAREQEVVALVASGLSNNEIADRLVVSPATAKTHVSRAMVKLHAHQRAQLVVFAYEAQLVVPRCGVSAPSDPRPRESWTPEWRAS